MLTATVEGVDPGLGEHLVEVAAIRTRTDPFGQGVADGDDGCGLGGGLPTTR